MNQNIKSFFERLLNKIFHDKSLSNQPKYLVQFEGKDDKLLRDAFAFIKTCTARGKVFWKFPLELVHLKYETGLRNPSSDPAVRTGKIPDKTQVSIEEALHKMGINDPENALYLTDHAPLDVNNQFGFIRIQSYQENESPSQILLNSASQGLFPVERSCYFLPEVRTSVIHLEKRNYMVRHPVLSEVPEIIRIEKSCWPEEIITPEKLIIERIKNFPTNQFVLEQMGRVAGVLYTQRITSIEQLYSSQAETLDSLNNPIGPIFQPITIFIDKKKQLSIFGDQFLEFALQLATLTPGITHAAGVTRCVEYQVNEGIEYEEYIKKRNQYGEIFDPILHMHERHGAEIVRVVPNFRPKDTQNNGYGVLIRYDLEKRNEKDIQHTPATVTEDVTQESIQNFVDEQILELLEHCGGLHRIDNRIAYRRMSGLMEMGLDSMQLLTLGTRISEKYQLDLEPTFFFSHSTPDAAIQYIIHNKINSVIEPKNRAMGTKQDEKNGIDEPIAIIGMGCRFPGGADSPEKFWDLLKNGVEMIREVPPERWDIDAYYDPDINAPGKMYARHGAFLENIDQFDAPFFRVSPREVEDMDPQQRIALEVAWEALENAGIPPRSVKRTQTGVFMGVIYNDYGQLIRQSGDPSAVDDYYSIGNHYSAVAGRISYFFGFNGPSMAIDSACSSSLVTVDIACEKLRLGSCDLALAGGVNLILVPETTINFCKSKMLSKSGHCKTFDADADGYVRGEGCGIIVLKRLSDAIKNGDRILAVIRTSFINQDGASTGFMAPNGDAQEKVMDTALKNANLTPAQIGYLEAHGTATPLGDTIEVKSVCSVYGKGRRDGLILGSVKTNLGHLEGAAGVAGLIKCVLSLQNELIPPNLNLNRINPLFDFSQCDITIPTEPITWKRSQKPRFAAVNSFGFVGTNAHIILQEAPATDTKTKPSGPYLLVLSARDEKSLEDQRILLKKYLETHFNVNLADVAYTLLAGREHFSHRTFLICNKIEDAITSLSQPFDYTVCYEENGKNQLTLDKSRLNACGMVWQMGLILNYSPGQKGSIIDLPTYPFQRKRYWTKPPYSYQNGKLKLVHPLLGQMFTSPHAATLFFGQLDLNRLPYLKDHKIYDYIIYPAAGYLEMLLAAARHTFGNGIIELTNVSIESALHVPAGKLIETQIIINSGDAGYEAAIYSQTNSASWICHAKGIISVTETGAEPKQFDLEALKSNMTKVIAIDEFYQDNLKRGLNLGDLFKTVDRIFLGSHEALVEISFSLSFQEYLAHPALFDGCIQLIGLPLMEQNAKEIHLPVGCDSLKFYAPLENHVFVYVQVTQSSDEAHVINYQLLNPTGKVLASIQGMHYRKTSAQALIKMVAHEKNLNDWLYDTIWQEHIFESDSTAELNGKWIILGGGDIAEKVRQLIELRGGTCQHITQESLPSTKLGFVKILENEDPVGIILATNIDKRSEVTDETIKTAQILNTKKYLHLTQAIAHLNRKTPLFLVGQSSLEQSTLKGLFKTVQIELPDIKMKHFEIDQNSDPSLLLDLIVSKSEESIFSLKEGKVYVPRIVKINEDKTKRHDIASGNPIKSDATYLITGGAGGLGLFLARWLIDKGARHLVVCGRKQNDMKLLAQPEFANIDISYESCDVSQEKSVENLIARLSEWEHPLKGIFHLAGVLDDATLNEQNWARFEKVFDSKVYGSFYLHKYSKDLDLFVLFSSVSSVFGNIGQSNYAAANAFMDALCEYRHEHHLPALSLSWGPWEAAGMAKDVVSRFAKGGMNGINPQDGIRVLDEVLLFSQPHLIIANINWNLFLKQMVAIPALFEAFAEKNITKDYLPDQLEVIEVPERLNFIKNYVSGAVKDVLRMASADPIDEKKGFADLGFDSLMSVELKNRLQGAIGKEVALATTAIFDHSSVEKLSHYIAQLLKVENIQLRKREQPLISVQTDEPIAIIGLSCRFPGGANNPEAFWDLIHNGRDAIREVPSDRWDAESYYDPDPAAPGKTITKKGGFLDIDVSLFDAEFFGISPREAEYIDPQHRLLLEVSYEAIESTGIDPASLQGTQTGVFVGLCTHDYGDLVGESYSAYMETGNMFSTAGGRISFVFDFQGPNFVVDTACSSSLVAIDQACQSLRNGTSNLALAGGVNLMLGPGVTINFSKAGMLAPDGHCKTFDLSANGYARGEGCGIVVLKRYSDAVRDGNRVFALVKASGINQDGASSGLTVPNGDAQEALINTVLAKARLKGSDIDYVEAHGTGTSLGDPIEVRAVGSTYGVRDPALPLKLGSVKTNIGHLEGAAGIAGVIKVVLSLVHETLPQNLHFQQLNPYIEKNFPFDILTNNVEWKRGVKTRRAAVSSFGFSGTNAHLIIEEAPLENAISTLAEGSNRHQFKRKRYWVDAAIAERTQNFVHPLLGEMRISPIDTTLFFGSIQLRTLSYLKDHVVYNHIIFPASGFIEMLCSAAKFGLGEGLIELSNFTIESALDIPLAKKVDTQVILTPNDTGYEAAIYAQTSIGRWNRHATGNIRINEGDELNFIDLENLKSRFRTPQSKKEFYSNVNSRGINYGSQFQVLEDVFLGDEEVLGELTLPISMKGYLAHPALLDGCLQLFVAYLFSQNIKDVFLPVGCASLKLFGQLEDHLFAHLKNIHITDEKLSGDLDIYSLSGKLLAQIQQMHCRKTSLESLQQMVSQTFNSDDWMYEWQYLEYTLENLDHPEPIGYWLILGDEAIAEEFKQEIVNRGGSYKSIAHNDLPESKEKFVDLLTRENPNGILYMICPAKEESLSTDNLRRAQEVGPKCFLHLTQALVQTNSTIPVCLVTHTDLANSTLNGLFKTIRLEHPTLKLKMVRLIEGFDPKMIFSVLFSSDNESLFLFNQDQVFVPRLIRQSEAKAKRYELTRPVGENFTLANKEKGLLENLRLIPTPVKQTLAHDEVEISVRAAGLNFRDVLLALGALDFLADPGQLGGDGAGVITRVGESVTDLRVGDAVLGEMNGSLGSTAYAHHDTIIVKPSHLSFDEAASVPTVFLTSLYAFTRSTKLKEGDTVLIHAAAGGVGQAAIQLAKLAGATIIATAGDDKKRAFLKKQGVASIFDSRSLTFAEEIKQATNGKGVDVVLNSLSGPGFIEATLSICKRGARFLEIGKRSIWTKEQMQDHRPDIVYDIILLDKIIATQPQLIQEMLRELMSLFEQGKLSPVPITIFPIEKSIQAFDYMKSANHIGKIVLSVAPQLRLEDRIHPEATYLITGGAGGIGQTVAKFLANKGARRIVLTGRGTLKTNFEIANCELIYESVDVGDELAVEDLIKRLTESAYPLKGIFHLAGVLDDAILMEQDWNHFESVFAAKVYGSYYLHKFSKNLDFFVMFSSFSSAVGNPGQCNYAAANAFMDALCEYRNEKGLPAHSISWSNWSEIGLAKDLVSKLATKGFSPIKPTDGMCALESVLVSNQSHTTIININWKKFLKQLIEVPSWLLAFAETKSSKGQLSLGLEAIEMNERVNFIKKYVTDTVRDVLGMSSSRQVDEKKGFSSMGLDSMLAVELKNKLQAGIGKEAVLATTALFDHPTVEKLSGHLAQLLKVDNIPIYKRKQLTTSVQPDEPIAIIGMSCRFPGGANDPETFWELLKNGTDAISTVPADRWDADAYFDPDPTAAGKMITKLGGFLNDDISLFDPDFFGISPREAKYIDPQHRLLLELSYEAIESAGIDSKTLQGTQTGVFIGICSHDYMDLINAADDQTLITPYFGTGNLASPASGRISYTFDFQGPNLAIDTACSSSLVAIDQACQSLRNGTASLALAGGVNLILAPTLSINFSKAGLLAPDGHCKTFDAKADGYVRGEGCGIVVLKRYSDALRDGNRILAVIKASGINQDGASSGLTVPNGEAQEALINHVLAKAKLKASDIDYVEAHGTGTSLGDPIEIRAIGSTYGVRDADHYLRLGSVKTNIGHLEGAAGIAGVIKSVLALQHEMIPAHLHFTKLNPHIQMNFPAEIVTKNQEWKRGDRTRRAAVSSFGFSGTNAHLIIEEAPKESSESTRHQNPVKHLFQRKRYWAIDSTPGPRIKHKSVHPLLGKMHQNPNNTISFYGELQLAALPFLKDHQIENDSIFPAAGFLEMILAAGKNALGEDAIEVTNLGIESPLKLSTENTDIQVLMSPAGSGYEISIHTQHNRGSWITHAKAMIALGQNKQPQTIDINSLIKNSVNGITKEEFYKQLKSRGVNLGKNFQTLDNIYVGNQITFGEVLLPLSTKAYSAHPALLDGCLQLLLLSLDDSSNALYLPVGCDSFTLFSPLENHVFAYWQDIEMSDGQLSGNLDIFNPSGILLASIRGFHAQKTTVDALKRMISHSHNIGDLIYVWNWQELILKKTNQFPKNKHWLILGDNSIANKLKSTIESTAGTCRIINHYDLPQNKEDFISLLHKENPAGILNHITSQAEKLSIDSINNALTFGVQNFLHLCQALIQSNLKIPLFLINESNIENSPLEGLFKTVLLEQPDLELKHIQLGTNWNAEMLVDAILTDNDDSIISLREGKSYVPRLLRYHQARGNELRSQNSIRPDATYLITGGLGGLGLVLAEWLVSKGATHLVLTGRRAHDESALSGADFTDIDITYKSLDITNEKEVEDLIRTLTESEHPLKGIFHLAGIIDDANVMDQSWQRFETVLAPKISGSYYLHKYSKDLDYFVLFSSLSSVLGNQGQSNYAAANAFMDALSHYRKEQGLPALSLSWGPWSDIGMAKDLVGRFTKGGVRGLSNIEGLQALEESLTTTEPHLTIANIDWNNYFKNRIHIPSWIKAFSAQKAHKEHLSVQLRAIAPEERLNYLKDYASRIVKEVLDLSPSEPIDVKKGFLDLGFDSLMVVELKNRLQAEMDTSIVLPSSFVFDNPTIDKLTRQLGVILKITGSEQENHPQSQSESRRKESIENEVENMGAKTIDDYLKKFEAGDG